MTQAGQSGEVNALTPFPFQIRNNSNTAPLSAKQPGQPPVGALQPLAASQSTAGLSPAPIPNLLEVKNNSAQKELHEASLNFYA